MSEVVWLGTPWERKGAPDVRNPYTSKLGGTAALFRRCDVEAQVLQCPKCGSSKQVSALCQIYAPRDVFDRVLYLLTCSKCTGKGSSFCFALRSQNFSRARYDEALQAATGDGGQEDTDANGDADVRKVPKSGEDDCGFTFAAAEDDWGADENDGGHDDWGTSHTSVPPAPSATADASPEEPAKAEAPALAPTEHESFPVCAVGRTGAAGGPVYGGAGIALDIYEEPPPPREDLGSAEEQLQAARLACGEENVDLTAVEEDDERREERAIRKYVERIGQNPSQCVRWCAGGAPLRASVDPITVPPCPLCHAPRHFEFQLTAPSIYYLTQDASGEDGAGSLSFSNVLVYTCSADCYDPHHRPYVREFVVTETEF